jgi:3',5'-cyclic AMP phosphodiesterase CpdA
MRRIPLFIILLIVALVGVLAAQELRLTSATQEPRPVAGASAVSLPNKDGSVKFLILGDTGTGDSGQTAIAAQVVAYREKFPFDFAILLGDNLYGSERPSDYAKKFERPYKALIDAGVKFYASLGNHDDPNQRMYKLFNMNGERYYSFKPSLTAGVRFFALDSNYMDPKQVEWLEKELAASGSDWKIAFFHHPPYASGMHGSHEVLRNQLEPLFLKHGVNVVFTGHEHFYERIKPQKGIQYFVAGGSAKLRRGDISKTTLTAFGYDVARTFMLAEIDGDQMYFQAINDKGQVIDSGVVTKGVNNRVIGTAGQGGAPKPAPKTAPAPKPAAPTPNSQRPTAK